MHSNLKHCRNSIFLDFVYTNQKEKLRDIALLSFLYDSAARVQEICDLTLSCIDFEKMSVCLHGKGHKIRRIPIMKRTINLIKNISLKRHKKRMRLFSQTNMGTK